MTNAHSIDTPVSKQEKKFKTKLTKPDFIKRAKSTHGDKFDYKDVSFDGALSKVKITCKECSTVFYPTVSAHMRGGNCPTCSRKQKIYCTNEDFKGKANKRHEGFYTYEKTDYVDSVTEVEINCPVHGLFFQRPKNHLKGSGCPDCGIDKAKRANDKNKTPFSEFVKKANNKHDNKYEYDEISYNGIRNTVRIKCKQHNWFEKRGLSHIAGEGCQECAAGMRRRKVIT